MVASWSLCARRSPSVVLVWARKRQHRIDRFTSSVGNVVDCFGTLIGIGDCVRGTVALYDVLRKIAGAGRLG